MKSVIILATLLTLVSCGKDGSNGANGADGSKSELAVICPDFLPETVHKEVLLKLTEPNGNVQFMAFLASTTYTEERLVRLEKGIGYASTDVRSARFNIIEDASGSQSMVCTSLASII